MKSIVGIILVAVSAVLLQQPLMAQQQNPQANPGLTSVSTVPSILLGPNAQGITTIQYTNGGTDPVPTGTIRIVLSLNQFFSYLSTIQAIGFSVSSPNPQTVVIVNTAPLPPQDGGAIDLRVVAVQTTGPDGNGGFAQKPYGATISVTNPQLVGNTSSADDNAAANISVGNVVMAPLPVTLMNFSATGVNCNTKIDWSTAAEADLDHYELEQSADGNRFTLLQKITGKGGVSNQYNVTFSNTAKQAYYRLVIVTKDGNRKYSKTVQVILNCDGAGVFSVYPNPVKKGETVTLQSTLAELVTYRITDATGKVTNTGRFQGRTDLPLQLAAGTYLIELSAGKEKKNVKVIVQ